MKVIAADADPEVIYEGKISEVDGHGVYWLNGLHTSDGGFFIMGYTEECFKTGEDGKPSYVFENQSNSCKTAFAKVNGKGDIEWGTLSDRQASKTSATVSARVAGIGEFSSGYKMIDAVGNILFVSKTGEVEVGENIYEKNKDKIAADINKPGPVDAGFNEVYFWDDGSYNVRASFIIGNGTSTVYQHSAVYYFDKDDNIVSTKDILDDDDWLYSGELVPDKKSKSLYFERRKNYSSEELPTEIELMRVARDGSGMEKVAELYASETQRTEGEVVVYTSEYDYFVNILTNKNIVALREKWSQGYVGEGNVEGYSEDSYKLIVANDRGETLDSIEIGGGTAYFTQTGYYVLTKSSYEEEKRIWKIGKYNAGLGNGYTVTSSLSPVNTIANQDDDSILVLFGSGEFVKIKVGTKTSASKASTSAVVKNPKTWDAVDTIATIGGIALLGLGVFLRKSLNRR